MFIRACFFIERETPALRALRRAGAFHPDRQLTNTEDPVAHASQRLAEANSLRTIIAEPQRKRRLARQRQLVEVTVTDLRCAEPIPPGRHEAAPDSALAIGCLHHLFEVAEEPFDAGDLEHAPQRLRPGLVAADAARPARTSGGDPCLAEAEASRDDAGPVGTHPDHEIGVAKARALPGLLDVRIEPDAHETARHLVGELRVIAGGDPRAADRQSRHL